MKLVVTEKPSVSQVLARHLSSQEYTVVSLSGHIMAVDYEGGVGKSPWAKTSLYQLLDTPVIKVPQGTGTTTVNAGLRRLRQALRHPYDQIILALDPDVQGHTIAHDVYQLLPQNTAISSVALESMDHAGITKAFREKRAYVDLGVQGDIKRRIDFIIGTILTRAVSLKCHKTSKKWSTYTVGRVQSVTLKYVSEREREILQFTPRTVRRVWVGHIKTPWIGHPDLHPEVAVTQVGRAIKKIGPFPGYHTSALLAQAARHPLFTNRGSQILPILEGMYLRGEISYPRTDNADYSNYPDLLRRAARVWSDHHGRSAIIPRLTKKGGTDHGPVTLLRTISDGDNPQERALKQILLDRMTQIFSGWNVYQVVTLDIAHHELGHSRHQVWLEKTKCFEDHRTSWSSWPPIPTTLELREQTSRAPPRYTFASLIEKMTRENIGTKSTRSQIIAKLARADIRYLRLSHNVYYPQQKTEILLQELRECFVLDSTLTKTLEQTAKTYSRENMSQLEQDYRVRIRDFLKQYVPPHT